MSNYRYELDGKQYYSSEDLLYVAFLDRFNGPNVAEFIEDISCRSCKYIDKDAFDFAKVYTTLNKVVMAVCSREAASENAFEIYTRSGNR